MQLFFQFRVVAKNVSNKRRTCEKRIILLEAASNRDAYEKGEKRGINSEYSYKNDDGNNVYFEFIGIMDMIELGDECDDDEVWYDIRDYIQPLERSSILLPEKNELLRRVSSKGL